MFALPCRSVTLAALLFSTLPACVNESTPKFTGDSPELAYRRSLGIPDEAKTVVVYSQSSHLDINWQRTFEEYQDHFVDGVLFEALDLLDTDQRAVYSMAEMGFLRVFWERYPEEHERLRTHIASGRFRIVGGAVTTPDTNLPPSESVIRDYVEGIRWIENAAGATVSTAWIPDSFGHNPLTPDLLHGLGMKAVGFSRLDGGPGVPFKIPKGLERMFSPYGFTPGSNATAMRDGGTQSFIWQGGGAAEVLGLYMPYTYCQGDSLGSPIPIAPPGIPLNLDFDVADALREMERYHEQLAPFDGAGYLFVPVGCDFQRPKELLTSFVDAWNRERYGESGTWAIRATFEEFSKLVNFRRDQLPVIPLDGNPVWTGYYGERPRIKQLSFLGNTWLTGHELLSVLTGDALPKEMADWWWVQALSNHHDWIPGTSPDEVWLTDQLNISEAMVAQAHDHLATRLRALAGEVSHAGPVIAVLNPAGVRRTLVLDVPADQVAINAPLHGILANGESIPVTVLTKGGKKSVQVEVELPPLGYTTIRLQTGAATLLQPVNLRLFDDAANPTTDMSLAESAVLSRADLSITFTRASAWAVTSIRSADGAEFIMGPSDQWVVYHDTGGLYQIGSEQGCDYTPIAGVPAPFQLTASSATGAKATLRFKAELYGDQVTREVSLSGNGPVTFTGSLRAPAWSTVVTRFQTSIVNGEHRNGVGYGSVARPYAHLYSPSYWPAIWSGLTGQNLGAIVSRAETTGFAAAADGQIELMLKRNAFEEQCAGLGAGGSDEVYDTLQYAFHPFKKPDQEATIASAFAETLPPLAVLADGTLGGKARLERWAAESHTPGIIPAAVHPHAADGFFFRVIRLDDAVATGSLSLGLEATRIAPADFRDRISDENVNVNLEALDTSLRMQSFHAR